MHYTEEVRTIMTTELVAITPDTPVNKLRSLFKTENLHHILVENEEGILEGMISPVDLGRTDHFTQGDEELTAKSIMTASLLKIHPEAPLKEVLDYFLDSRFRAMPVVDPKDKVVGIVTPYDLMLALKERFAAEEEAEKHFDNV